MARRLSKKKITGWLLLFAVIIFFCTRGKDEAEKVVATVHPKPEIPIDDKLTHRLDSFVQKTSRDSISGIYVYDLTARREVYAHNANTKLSPASNMKMLTCIAVLDELGSSYKYKNEVYFKGTMKRDTLVGDLSFKFTFDPNFNNETLRQLTDAVSAKGIRYVKGRVVVDVAMKEPMQHEEHWTIGDLKTRKFNMLFRGEKRVVGDVKYLLNLSGVHYADKDVVVEKVPQGSTLIKEVASSIKDPIFKAMQNSSNTNAEALLFLLAGNGTDSDDFRRRGVVKLKTFLRDKLAVNADDMAVIHDGSGLCCKDKMTPKLLCRLFEYAYDNKDIYNTLLEGLPVAGENGTLHNRLRKAKGVIRAKTGTLTREGGITSLAGYTQGSNGHDLIFVIIENGYPVADARIWQDRFCSELLK